MTGKTERVVLVKGDEKKWYKQAIFIVNADISAESLPVDFVAEAEKIISEYNLKSEDKKAAPKNVIISPAQLKVPPLENDIYKPSIVVSVLMVLACIVIITIITHGLLR